MIVMGFSPVPLGTIYQIIVIKARKYRTFVLGIIAMVQVAAVTRPKGTSSFAMTKARNK